MTGSSPRVRSRLSDARARFRQPGIISACAEQTLQVGSFGEQHGDHLRVCGADSVSELPMSLRSGSSPRVRSRRWSCLRAANSGGIISACAEQTWKLSIVRCARKDHLRVCGTDRHQMTRLEQSAGSSPRVRSRQQRRRNAARQKRIISACAEQTSAQLFDARMSVDHLRVCGADAKQAQFAGIP